MSTAGNLRDQARELRDHLPPRRQTEPPTENGRRIGTLERSANEQIRVNWCEYEGKPYVSFRLWTRNDQGQWWPDGKRGMSVRIRELPDLAEGIAEAMDLAEGLHRPQQPRPMPGRPFSGGQPDFNECEEPSQ